MASLHLVTFDRQLFCEFLSSHLEPKNIFSIRNTLGQSAQVKNHCLLVLNLAFTIFDISCCSTTHACEGKYTHSLSVPENHRFFKGGPQSYVQGAVVFKAP